ARGREALEDLAAVLAALLGLEDGEARLVPARFAREERRDSQPRLAVAARLGFSPQGTERLVTHDSIDEIVALDDAARGADVERLAVGREVERGREVALLEERDGRDDRAVERLV